MHTIETLQAKKAVLVAQRDQLMGQFNMTNGAIAMVDELMGDLQREAETQKQLNQVAKDMAAEAMALAAEQTAGAMAKLHEPDPPVAPEMLPVSHFEACASCSNVLDCEDHGCAAVMPTPVGASA